MKTSELPFGKPSRYAPVARSRVAASRVSQGRRMQAIAIVAAGLLVLAYPGLAMRGGRSDDQVTGVFPASLVGDLAVLVGSILFARSRPEE